MTDKITFDKQWIRIVKKWIDLGFRNFYNFNILDELKCSYIENDDGSGGYTLDFKGPILYRETYYKPKFEVYGYAPYNEEIEKLLKETWEYMEYKILCEEKGKK